MSFVGAATVATAARPTVFQERYDLDAPNSQGKVLSEYYIELKSVRLFKTPVAIRPLKTRLRFIVRPQSTKWALPLVGGVTKITEADFETVKLTTI